MELRAIPWLPPAAELEPDRPTVIVLDDKLLAGVEQPHIQELSRRAALVGIGDAGETMLDGFANDYLIGFIAGDAKPSIVLATLRGAFNHAVLDDCRTSGLNPDKTHWARPIDTPPFWGYPLRPGITFTYLGLKVDDRARVMMSNGEPTSNVFAAGEIMAGNILGQGDVAGVGMTIGTVFGRIAGAEAGALAVA